MAYPPDPEPRDESRAAMRVPKDPLRRMSPEARRKFLQLARDRFKQAQTAENAQRERELDDLRFYAGDQWPSDVKASRAGMEAANGLPPVPARPCITINKTRQPVREVLNQERGSDIAIEIVPADDFGDLTGPVDETEIKLREGLIRRIQRESNAADARTWAFARATIAGRGYYVVRTRYAEGKTNDQEVYVSRLYNQACATLDPAHEQPDGSDAEWEFIGTDMSWESYKAEHGRRNGKKNALVDGDMSDEQWRQLGDEQPEWFKGEGDTRKIRVVEYFYVVWTPRELCTLMDGTLAWEDEMPEGAPIVEDRTRTVVERSIKWAKIDGSDDDVLEETDWPGPDMPIVKTLGEELQPYDEEKRAEGMVRPMREPGQGNNVMVSKLVELIGLTPIPSLMMAEGQDEGYEAWYIAANTRTLPKLPYRQKDLAGDPAPPPFQVPRNPEIAPVAQAIAMFDDAIQSTSQVSRPAMGDTDSTVKSAKHANLLREQALQGTSNYLDNLMRSMRYEGQIINNLLYPIYGRRPGRIARIVNGQGEAETLIVGQPMVQQGGRPVAAQENDPSAKKYQLTKDAKFNVGIKITQAKEFRREQANQMLGELISGAPQLMTVFGDLYLKNADIPGHDEMADRMKVMLDPKILQMLEAKKSGQDVPPELMAKLTQAQEQMQQMQQQLQQAGQIIQQKQVEEQAETQRKERELAADLQKAQVEADVRIRIAAMEQETALRLEEMKLRGTMMQAEIDAAEAQRAEQAAGQTQQRDQAHEAGMAAMNQQAASGAQAGQQEHEAAMQAEQQRAAQEQAAMAAQQQGGVE
jgi:hypothetical protein